MPCFFTFLIWTCSAIGLAGDSVLTREAPEHGQHVVVVVPAPPHDASIGIARQLATLPLQRGKLTLVQAEIAPPSDQLESFLAEILPAGDRPDWVWVHQGAVGTNAAGEKITSPTISLPAAEKGRLGRIAEKALGADAALHPIPTEPEMPMAKGGVMAFAYPSGTPPSRQVRFTRQLAVALLRACGLLAEDTDFCWGRLSGHAPRLIALYDAQGIGGNGPVNLEQIAAERLEGVGIYRVCGEDIREGALAPAAGTIFPGGSGRGIGDGLQEEGREILRNFIASGGGYLGVCAGAYFAGSGLENYLQAIRLRHSQPWARGRGMLDIELTPEGKEFFGDPNPVMHTRYANGPVFLAAEQTDGGDPNFVILARFKTPSTDSRGTLREEMVGEAAVGAVQYGEGRLLIISPHPESHEEYHDFVARGIEWTLRPTTPTPCAAED